MIIKPRVRNFICLTAHPVGCASAVKRQIEYVKNQPPIDGPKRALIIGTSTGYGLASRIAAAFGLGADTVGVMLEKPSRGKRTATAGYYNNLAFEEAARADNLVAVTINGDAFSAECKTETIAAIKDNLGQVDLIVYSLAAPRRTDSDGTTWSSVIKPTGETFVGKTLNLSDNTVDIATLEPATEEEVAATIKVMGGEDWAQWLRALRDADALAPNAVTLAYSYIGPEMTHAIYRDGSIGQAKKDLYRTADSLNEEFSEQNLTAKVSVNKAVVTQASAAIPSVSLYISVLYKLMKEEGSHEGCIEQMYRLLAEKVYGEAGITTDEDGLIRLDDWEMKPDLQAQVKDIWNSIETDNLAELADVDGYWEDFYQMFGFYMPDVDYEADITDY
ncbi:MAG TPA: trans-2-enoyl-CoA reductase family protein [Clostridiaceae bacterium]|nr:trans-2-enoyl-CoA reductase family protein [Clostridiaceae bacterium]